MSKIIHICHFLNPYCFYFKFDDDLHDDGLGRLEDEISKYARDKINQSSDEKTTIAVGYTVAAYVISWGKWVRSVIRSDLDIWNCYELWAIDHGRPFRAAHGNVVVLPVHLANGKFNGARRGSVYGLSPAKLDFNMETCKSEHRQMDNWSEKATQQCREVINGQNVAAIFFEIKATYGDCYFGEISIQTLSKKVCSIAEPLISIDEAIYIDFEPELDRIEAKYRKFYLKDAKHDIVNDRAEFMNGPSVRQMLQTVQQQIRGSAAESVIQSTIVSSEIDGGITRMQMKKGLRIPTPSVAPSSAQSTVVSSEIDNGATRMQMKRGLQFALPSGIGNDTAQMSNKSNRKLATNYVNGIARRQRPPMPAGHEPDMDKFTMYNA